MQTSLSLYDTLFGDVLQGARGGDRGDVRPQLGVHSNPVPGLQDAGGIVVRDGDAPAQVIAGENALGVYVEHELFAPIRLEKTKINKLKEVQLNHLRHIVLYR